MGTDLAKLLPMRSILTYIALAMALLPGLCAGAYADPGALSDGETALFDLINQARENPRVTAESLGIDADALIAEIPEMDDIITNGLPPLTRNDRLRAAGLVRTEGTLQACCDGEESFESRTLARRIADAGYVAVGTGESTGIILFANFIEPATAAGHLFEEMIRDELDPERTEPRVILNPDLEEIGIALGTGTYTLERQSFNMYMVSCVFGAGADVPGLQLFNLINQARTNPLDTAASLGMDTEALLDDYPLLYEVLTVGLPPLAFDARLYRAARAHTLDMLEAEYYSGESPDGRTYEDRIREAGYEAVDAGEAVGLMCRTICDEPGEAPTRFLRKMFTGEIEAGEPDAMTILNPLLAEGGIAIADGTSVELGGICGDEVILLTADFGAEEQFPERFLAGVTYVDANENGRYDAGEGAPAALTVTGPDGTASSLSSGETGYFVLPLGEQAAAGLYEITMLLESDGRGFARNVEVGDSSVQAFIGAPPADEETDPSDGDGESA